MVTLAFGFFPTEFDSKGFARSHWKNGVDKMEKIDLKNDMYQGRKVGAGINVYFNILCYVTHLCANEFLRGVFS